jgi:hypothetical protein
MSRHIKKQEVIEKGEFIEDYPIDSYTEANVGIEEHYRYKGKDYYFKRKWEV